MPPMTALAHHIRAHNSQFTTASKSPVTSTSDRDHPNHPRQSPPAPKTIATMKFAAILAFALAAPHATIDAAGLGQARPVADAGQVQVAADAGQTPAAECASKVYCMDGNAYTDDTFGTQIGGTTCSAACGDNCCIERNACARGRFTVCADPGDGSCNGVGACNNVGGDGTAGLISGGSCVGQNACSNAGNRGGRVGDITGGSCVGTIACQSAGSGGTVGNIQDQSCTGNDACAWNGGDGGTIGNIFGGSCQGRFACQGMGYGGQSLVGEIYGSCNADHACYTVGRGTPWGRSIISCCNDETRICDGVGYVYNNNGATLEVGCEGNTIPTPTPPAPAQPWTITATLEQTGGTGRSITISGEVDVEILGALFRGVNVVVG